MNAPLRSTRGSDTTVGAGVVGRAGDAVVVVDGVVERPDGLYLEITPDKEWAGERTRRLVNTELLGKAKIPGVSYENADGSPLQINTDFFGKKRSDTRPAPGPFEKPGTGQVTFKLP